MANTQIEQIIKQVRYYFSPQNLVKDLYLRSQMDSEGWVSFNVLLKFGKLVSMNCTAEDLLEVCEKLNERLEYRKVDTLGDYQVRVKKQSRPGVLIRDIPANTPENEIKALFSQDNQPLELKFELSGWVCHFDTLENARVALEHVQIQQWNGKNIRCSLRGALSLNRSVEEFRPSPTNPYLVQGFFPNFQSPPIPFSGPSPKMKKGISNGQPRSTRGNRSKRQNPNNGSMKQNKKKNRPKQPLPTYTAKNYPSLPSTSKLRNGYGGKNFKQYSKEFVAEIYTEVVSENSEHNLNDSIALQDKPHLKLDGQKSINLSDSNAPRSFVDAVVRKKDVPTKQIPVSEKVESPQSGTESKESLQKVPPKSSMPTNEVEQKEIPLKRPVKSTSTDPPTAKSSEATAPKEVKETSNPVDKEAVQEKSVENVDQSSKSWASIVS